MQIISPVKRYLYFGSNQLRCLHETATHFKLEAIFTANTQSIANFRKYVQNHADCNWCFVVDTVEEDFACESIPLLWGNDRLLVLRRKIAQRYRNSSYTLFTTIGKTNGVRREEQVLLSAFTNAQQFQPWLTELQKQKARLVGIYSVSFPAPRILDRLMPHTSSAILVSANNAGLRQSYVLGNKLRFSRLGKLDSLSPAELAQTYLSETLRLHQYLIAMQIMPRHEKSTVALMIVPDNLVELTCARCANNSELRFQIISVSQAHSKCGVGTANVDSLAETLYLQSIGQHSRSLPQYANQTLRLEYRLWWLGRALYRGSGLTAAFTVVLAFIFFMDTRELDSQTHKINISTNIALDRYAELEANYPKSPIPAAELRILIKNIKTIEENSTSARDFLIPISNALQNTPQIDIDYIAWGPGSGTETTLKGNTNRPSSEPVRGAESPLHDGSVSRLFQLSEIKGRISVAQSSDYRAISAIAEQFASAINKQPGFQLVALRLPFEINAEKSLQGMIGADRTTSPPEFALQLARAQRSRANTASGVKQGLLGGL
jgi:hypothetical protein